MFTFKVATLSFVLWTVQQSVCQDIGYDYPIETVNNLGESARFTCAWSTVPNDTVPTSWMFPDLTVVDNNYNDSNRWIQDDGYTFVISSVQMSDIGLFHCMLKTEENEWWLLKIGLNVRGPYFEDMWEKYRLPVIYGFSAMFSFLFAAGYVYLVYWFNYERRLDRESAITPYGVNDVEMNDRKERGSYTMKLDKDEVSNEPGHANGAYENGEVKKEAADNVYEKV